MRSEKSKWGNVIWDANINTPEQFGAIIKSDLATIGKVIKDAGIRAD